MTQAAQSLVAGAASAGRRRLISAVWLVLLAPGAAYPYSLGELLRMPLEQLLRVEISPPRVLVTMPLSIRVDHGG